MDLENVNPQEVFKQIIFIGDKMDYTHSDILTLVFKTVDEFDFGSVESIMKLLNQKINGEVLDVTKIRGIIEKLSLEAVDEFMAVDFAEERLGGLSVEIFVSDDFLPHCEISYAPIVSVKSIDPVDVKDYLSKPLTK